MCAPNRFSTLLITVLLLAALPLLAVTYVPVVEWNGTHFHVMNSSGIYNLQPVDNPVVDVPFSNSNSVMVWADAAGSYNAYVVDSFQDRVQFFATDIDYEKDATTGGTGTLAWTSPAAAGGDFDATTIMLNNGGVVRGSELLMVGGNTYTRVNSLAGYTSSDYVYTIVYEGAAATGGVFTLPAASLTNASVISVEYAYTSTVATNLAGDIDYVVAAAAVNGTVVGDPFEINEVIPNNTGHPSAFENIVSVFFHQNMAATDEADVYVLESGEIGASVDPKLYTFQVEDDAAVTFGYEDTYDNNALNQPQDVCVAETGTGNLLTDITAVETSVTLALGALTADPNNNALFPNHQYTLTVVTGTGMGAAQADMSGIQFDVLDKTTGNIITRTAATTGAVGPYYVSDAIPGVTIVITAAVGPGFSQLADGDILDFNLAAAGDYGTNNDYIFICDSGNDRIKILKAGENGEPEVGSARDGNYDTDNILAGTALFADDADRMDYYSTVAAAVPNITYVSALRPMENTYTVYTKSTFTATDSTQWTRIDNFAGSGASDNHFMYDYDTQVLTFGDGNYGAIPTAGHHVFAFYRPCLDVLDYGSTGSSNGRFSNPCGVTARYNTAHSWFDVYVSDTDNNRIAKLKYTPPSTGQDGTVEWVTSWTSTYTGGTALDSPTDLVIISDGGAAAADTVYLFVCDTGNDRVIVYRDTEAENEGDGGTTAPTFSTSFGNNGTGLGQFSKPVGIAAILQSGTTSFDVYIADAERNYVTKYSPAGDEPQIDCDYSNVNSYGYLPSGSYTFAKNTAWTYMARNYPSSAYIQFYYSDTTTAGQASPTLCSSTQHAATITSFEWVFANSPGGTPSDGPKYLYARLYDSNSIFLAEDKSAATQLLTIDSDLLNGLGGLDRFDDDKYFYVQNGSLRQFNLITVYPDSVASINYTGTFPASQATISSIDVGPAWQTIQNQGVIFEADWDNTNGTFAVNTGVLGTNTGLVAGPPTFTVGIVTVQVSSTAVTPTSRVYYGDFDITGGLWADYTGTTLASPTLNDLSLRIGYLGDIADPDSSHGTIPNMIPCPDGEFGIDDIVVFSMAWNGIGGTQDPIADLAPYNGTVPNIWASPDGNIDVQDLMAFTLMFDWYQAQDFSASPRYPNSDGGDGSIASTGGSSVYVDVDAYRDGDKLIVGIYADDVEELMSAELNVSFDGDVYSLESFDRGDFLTGSVFFKGYEREDGLQLFLSSLNREASGFSGSGKLAALEFTVTGEEADIEVGFDLRNTVGERIETGSLVVELGSGSVIPTSFIVETAYPNPFNPSVTVPFAVPEAGMVEIAVFDVLGREVYSQGRQYQAGHHRFVLDTGKTGSSLSGGVYFLKVTYNDQVQSQKIVFMK